MAKRYLSLDEAAQKLGIAKDQLVRFREQGDIRGFADRGSWKFREEDVEEFLRSRQTDSSPDFPIIPAEDAESVLDDEHSDDLSSSDSDVRLYFDQSLFDDDEEDLKKLKDSDSDVRLTGDSGPNLESAAPVDDLSATSMWEPSANLTDSDSDVKLVGSRTDADIDLADLGQSFEDPADSATNFSLADSDSDVRLAESSPEDEKDDSGISLFEDLDSDSDVKLTGLDDLLADDDDSRDARGLQRTDSDIRLMDDDAADVFEDSKTAKLTSIPADDSDLKLIDSAGSRVRREEPDSGITFEPQGSALSLDADESGISLDLDSGISLEADDSGISLHSFDSGAKLADDSGISLDASDSGISLDLADDSGISLDDDNAMGRTMPMGSVPGARSAMEDSQESTTQFQSPGGRKNQDSVFNLEGMDDDEPKSKKTMAMQPASRKVLDTDDDITDQGEDFSDESYDDDSYAEDEFSDDMGDDTYADDEFGDGDDSEEESGGFVSPAASGRARSADVDWGTGTKVMLGIGSLLSVLCGLVGVELVRTMWLWTQTDGTKSAILEMIGGLFA
jgi:excisionase family DNA binding protein